MFLFVFSKFIFTFHFLTRGCDAMRDAYFPQVNVFMRMDEDGDYEIRYGNPHLQAPQPSEHVSTGPLQAREVVALDFSGCSGSAVGCCCLVRGLPFRCLQLMSFPYFSSTQECLKWVHVGSHGPDINRRSGPCGPRNAHWQGAIEETTQIINSYNS